MYEPTPVELPGSVDEKVRTTKRNLGDIVNIGREPGKDKVKAHFNQYGVLFTDPVTDQGDVAKIQENLLNVAEYMVRRSDRFQIDDIYDHETKRFYFDARRFAGAMAYATFIPLVGDGGFVQRTFYEGSYKDDQAEAERHRLSKKSAKPIPSEKEEQAIERATRFQDANNAHPWKARPRAVSSWAECLHGPGTAPTWRGFFTGEKANQAQAQGRGQGR
jgi:hypothetical protein